MAASISTTRNLPLRVPSRIASLTSETSAWRTSCQRFSSGGGSSVWAVKSSLNRFGASKIGSSSASMMTSSLGTGLSPRTLRMRSNAASLRVSRLVTRRPSRSSFPGK